MKTLATMFQPFGAVDPTLSMGDVTTGPHPVDVAASSNPLEPRYAVRSILGRGGMGEVRLCRDARVGRDVAVKVALHGASARFLREARVQGQLEHPSIVPVYDLEILDDGSAYLVMKRVKGKTLSELLREDTLPLRKLLGVFNNVCLAVQMAHERGVTHRDIKPGNIMVGDFGEVYLLDWGLAKLSGDGAEERATDSSDDGRREAVVDPGAAEATVDGALLGTPGYMAPEQIDPGLGGVGPAADIYALGAVLFEILARQPYIRAKDTIEATLLTLQGSEQRPALRSPDRAIPEVLDAVCHKALARQPTDRFSSARALHDAVDKYLAGEQEKSQRTEMSRMHMQSAERALTEPGEEARSRALAELGRAIAVDPHNDAARAALLRLLTSPPTVTPPAVLERIREDRARQMRDLCWYTFMTTVPYFAFAPYALWVGIRDLWMFSLLLVALVASAATSVGLFLSKRPPSQALQYASIVFFLLAHIALTRIAGPVAFLPALLVAFATARQVHPDVWHRRITTVMVCSVLGASLVVEAMAPQYVLMDGGLFVGESLLRFNDRTMWFFVLSSVGAILTPSVFIARSRAQLARAEASLHLQRWQLEQLVRT